MVSPGNLDSENRILLGSIMSSISAIRLDKEPWNARYPSCLLLDS